MNETKPAPRPQPTQADRDRADRFVWREGDITIQPPPKASPKPKSK